MKKALIIDDDQGIRELLEKYLTKMDYHISVAKDAKNEINLFKTACGDFDLVIVDVENPVRHQNGIDRHESACKNIDHLPMRSLVAFLPAYKKNYFLCSS